MLVFSQAFKFHMHVQHVGDPSPSAQHVIAIHSADILGDLTDKASHESVDEHHHPIEIDVSLDSIATKIDLSNSMALIFLIVSVLLLFPLLPNKGKYSTKQIQPSSSFSLLSPPLRAPPA